MRDSGRVARASQAAEKGPHSFCHSERSEESLFLFLGFNRREIPRFARNDKINYFFRSLGSLRVLDSLDRKHPHPVKPALPTPRVQRFFRQCNDETRGPAVFLLRNTG